MHSKSSGVLSERPIYLKSRKICRFVATFVLWATLGLPASTAWAHQAQVYGGTGCVDNAGLEGRISQILNAFAPQRADTQDLTARMSVSLSAMNLSVSIKLSDASGRIALARRYQLHKDDCPDVPDLLSLVLQEYLREFPENPWREMPESQREQEPTQKLSATKLRLGISLLSEINPAGAKFETNAHIQGPIISWLSWQTGLQARVGLPQDLSSGSYQRIEFLMGAGLAIQTWHTIWDIQLLGGGYVVAGNAFNDNRVAIAPALEINLSTRWYWEKFSLGPSLGLSLLQHQVQVLPENTQEPISILNIGLTLQYDTI